MAKLNTWETWMTKDYIQKKNVNAKKNNNNNNSGSLNKLFDFKVHILGSWTPPQPVTQWPGQHRYVSGNKGAKRVFVLSNQACLWQHRKWADGSLYSKKTITTTIQTAPVPPQEFYQDFMGVDCLLVQFPVICKVNKAFE